MDDDRATYDDLDAIVGGFDDLDLDLDLHIEHERAASVTPEQQQLPPSASAAGTTGDSDSESSAGEMTCAICLHNIDLWKSMRALVASIDACVPLP